MVSFEAKAIVLAAILNTRFKIRKITDWSMLRLLRSMFVYVHNWQTKMWKSEDVINTVICIAIMLGAIGCSFYFAVVEIVPRLLKRTILSPTCAVNLIIIVCLTLFIWMYFDMVRSKRYVDLAKCLDDKHVAAKGCLMYFFPIIAAVIIVFDVYPWAYDMYPDNCMTVECRSENVNRRYSEFVARDLPDVVNGLFGFDRNELNLDACACSRFADFSLKPEDTIFMEFRYDKTVKRWSFERLQSVSYGGIAVWDTLYQAQKGRRGSIPPRVAVRLIIRNDSVIGLDAKSLRFGPNPEYILAR